MAEAYGLEHASEVYEPEHLDGGSFRAAIAQGSRQHHWTFGDMPPVEDMTPDDESAGIAYNREMQRREGFEHQRR